MTDSEDMSSCHWSKSVRVDACTLGLMAVLRLMAATTTGGGPRLASAAPLEMHFLSDTTTSSLHQLTCTPKLALLQGGGV